ncbi:TIGR02206 family membrane protein [Bacillus sp. PS06]|uniref:YwaF family protein n=1 Tax=Bacillus sp. PS06 TaxID=2764176 RepID=UPI00177F569A|nr:TIGR02206 family membrane protein [Bacillus sp. PS06]MBD8068916.1 TIGR02206 family membrane protein [Bacillus sp. PS06]
MIEKYAGFKVIGEPFQLFSLSHIVMLLLLVSTVVAFYLLRNSISGSGRRIIRYFLAGLLLVSELTLYIWYSYTGVWNPVDSLPFQLCSISLMLSIVMLFTRNFLLFEVTLFLGVGGALQAMITPELAYDFPHYRYFHFFLAHIAIILASLYMIWFEGYRPTMKSVWKAFGALNVLAVFVFIVNKWTGGNYMFLSRKPTNPSLIDLLGPYPWYLLSLEVAALGIFCLIYLPFAFVEEKKRARA